MRTVSIIFIVHFIVACGAGVAPLSTQTLSISKALTGTAEGLEFESVSVRQRLFREIVTQSQLQVDARGAVLFPVLVGETFVGAPAMTPQVDLLQVPDAGVPRILTFDTPQLESFSTERREALQGLSEREAAELVARTLLHHWNILAHHPVTVLRASRAPYAAAWIGGELRLNPAFIYLATTPLSP